MQNWPPATTDRYDAYLPTLLLAVSAPLVLFDQHRAGISIQPIAPTTKLPNQKPIRTFSTGPNDFGY
jgi:hypothetical protein